MITGDHAFNAIKGNIPLVVWAGIIMIPMVADHIEDPTIADWRRGIPSNDN